MGLPTLPQVALNDVERLHAAAAATGYADALRSAAKEATTQQAASGALSSSVKSSNAKNQRELASLLPQFQVPEVTTLRYRVFAKALLDGDVFPQVKRVARVHSFPTERLLTSRLMELPTTCGLAVADLVSALQASSCADKADLLRHFRSSSNRNSGVGASLYLACLPKHLRAAAGQALQQSLPRL
ncbi:unnamed protein product [Amoebophrya sp. A25]|nr:unnamed protein product [Amoebophrya sp. A25]|eukprot:GSA25T00013434001.1